MITVVIKNNDFGLNAGLLKRRAQVSLHESRLLASSHKHAGCIVWILRLVLKRDGVYGYTLCSHALNVFHKIQRVRVVKFRLEAPTLRQVVGLHPNRRGPGAAHYLKIGIERKYLLQEWNQMLAIFLESKVF